MEEKTNNSFTKGPQYVSLRINAISNWGPLGVNLLVGFLLTPYLIFRLGNENYGIWVLVGSFLGYYGLLQLGVGAGIMRYVPFYTGRDDLKTVSVIMSTGLAIFLLVGLVIVVISLLIAEPIADFYKAGPSLASLVRILGFAAAIECPLNIFDAIVRARERWVLANVVVMLTVVMRAVGLWGSVRFGYGVVQMGYVVLAVTILHVILIVYLFRKVCPLVNINPFTFKLSFVKVLLSFGLLSTIVSLAWSFTLEGHSLIIGKLISLKAVSIYSIAAIIMKNIRAVSVNPNRTFWPRFAHLDGENKKEEISALFYHATYYNAILASWVMLLVFVAGPSFVRLWVGDSFSSVFPALMILAVGYLIETSLAVTAPLLGGIGRQKVQALMAVAEGVIGLGLSILLTWKMGLAGTALGFTISVALIRGLICPWYICRLFELSILRYYLDFLLRPWSIVLAIAITIYLLNLTRFTQDWPSLIFLVSVTAVLFAILAYYICMDSNQKKSLLDFLWRILQKSKCQAKI